MPSPGWVLLAPCGRGAASLVARTLPAPPPLIGVLLAPPPPGLLAGRSPASRPIEGAVRVILATSNLVVALPPDDGPSGVPTLAALAAQAAAALVDALPHGGPAAAVVLVQGTDGGDGPRLGSATTASWRVGVEVDDVDEGLPPPLPPGVALDGWSAALLAALAARGTPAAGVVQRLVRPVPDGEDARALAEAAMAALAAAARRAGTTSQQSSGVDVALALASSATAAARAAAGAEAVHPAAGIYR